jgi:hypothetical protein
VPVAAADEVVAFAGVGDGVGVAVGVGVGAVFAAALDGRTNSTTAKPAQNITRDRSDWR